MIKDIIDCTDEFIPYSSIFPVRCLIDNITCRWKNSNTCELPVDKWLPCIGSIVDVFVPDEIDTYNFED